MSDNYVLQACQTEEEISAAFKLRYVAYKNVDAIHENPEAEFKDKYDFLENSTTCLIYEENKPVASLRTCIYDKEQLFMEIPAFEVYREEIEREIGFDKKIIESNRFVIDPEKVDSKQLFKIPFRFVILNALKFECDYLLTAVRPKHVSIYKRFFGLEPISTPKKYPGINVEMVIMAGDCARLIPIIMEREELYRFTEEDVNDYIPRLGVFRPDLVTS
jgi:hypothetical protein